MHRLALREEVEGVHGDSLSPGLQPRLDLKFRREGLLTFL